MAGFLMARPKVERKARMVRLPIALDAELVARAAASGVSVNEAIELAVIAWNDGNVIATDWPRDPPPAPFSVTTTFGPSVPAQPPASPSREVPTFFKKSGK